MKDVAFFCSTAQTGTAPSPSWKFHWKFVSDDVRWESQTQLRGCLAVCFFRRCQSLMSDGVHRTGTRRVCSSSQIVSADQNGQRIRRWAPKNDNTDNVGRHFQYIVGRTDHNGSTNGATAPWQFPSTLFEVLQTTETR